MATIKRSTSTKVDANGMMQLHLYVVNGRKGRFRIVPGILVPDQYWNKKKLAIVTPQKADMNTRNKLNKLREEIEKTETRILQIVDIYEDTNREFVENTLSLLKDYNGTVTREVVDLLRQKANDDTEFVKHDIFLLAQKYLEQKNFSSFRFNAMKVIFRSMQRYEYYKRQIKHVEFQWDIDKVTKEMFEDYFAYLADEHNIYAKHHKKFDNIEDIYNPYFMPKYVVRDFQERGANRLVGMKKHVKAFWNWLLQKGYTDNNPLLRISIGTEVYGTPYYLTLEERNIIAQHNFSENKHLETQRDIFVFHCMIGCRIGDLMSFTYANIVDEMLVYTPHKTKDESKSFVARVPLYGKALELLEKYKDKDPKGRLFPFIAEQNYNYAIKDIVKECGITRTVSVRNPKTGEEEMKPIYEVASSHMARRTFVGNAYKLVKDPNIIGRMSGHVEGSRAFARYRNIDDETLKEVISALQ